MGVSWSDSKTFSGTLSHNPWGTFPSGSLTLTLLASGQVTTVAVGPLLLPQDVYGYHMRFWLDSFTGGSPSFTINADAQGSADGVTWSSLGTIVSFSGGPPPATTYGFGSRNISYGSIPSSARIQQLQVVVALTDSVAASATFHCELKVFSVSHFGMEQTLTVPPGMNPSGSGLLLIMGAAGDTADAATLRRTNYISGYPPTQAPSASDHRPAATFVDGSGTVYTASQPNFLSSLGANVIVGQDVGIPGYSAMVVEALFTDPHLANNTQPTDVPNAVLNAGGTVRIRLPSSLDSVSIAGVMLAAIVDFPTLTNYYDLEFEPPFFGNVISNPPNPRTISWSDPTFANPPGQFGLTPQFAARLLVGLGNQAHVDGSGHDALTTAPLPVIGEPIHWSTVQAVHNGASWAALGELIVPYAPSPNSATASSQTEVDSNVTYFASSSEWQVISLGWNPATPFTVRPYAAIIG